MLTARVVKAFKHKGQVIPPGTRIQIPEAVLPDMAGYVVPERGHVIPIRPGVSEPSAWLVNGELRTYGVIPDLEAEITRLCGVEHELRDKLLARHVQAYHNRHLPKRPGAEQ